MFLCCWLGCSSKLFIFKVDYFSNEVLFSCFFSEIFGGGGSPLGKDGFLIFKVLVTLGELLLLPTVSGTLSFNEELLFFVLFILFFLLWYTLNINTKIIPVTIVKETEIIIIVTVSVSLFSITSLFFDEDVASLISFDDDGVPL